MFAKSTHFKSEKAEVVRIRVKKCDGLMQPEYKKLCVDPQITSFDIIKNLLARAFNIKGNFTISYLAKDDKGQEMYLSMLSDWDLDAAFLGSSDPYLRLKVDLKPFEEGLEDWDILSDSNSSQLGTGRALLQDSAAIFGTLTGTITTHVSKTVSQVSKAMGLWNEEHNPPVAIKPPMTDIEFHNFMDGVGHMIQPGEFRLSVFRGGVDPALRKVVWRHLLNIFPEDLSGKERFNYLQSKVREYYKLRDEWRAFFLKGDESEEIRMVANMVKKDVLRTDRNHKFYAGADDNKNILSLFNLLVTYAVTHPDVLYCQGMSDLASPILIVQEDEANAYICFCGLMTRLKSNFTVDGLAMTAKFQHLSLLLQHQDPDFYAYLKQHNAADMFFSYRWLLLELKREFPLDQALTMFEIMWSSLPPDPPEKELLLTDPQYQNAGILFSPTQQPNVASQAYFLLRSRMRKPPEAIPGPASAPANTAGAGEVSLRANDVITPCEDINVDMKEFTEVDDVATVEILRSKAALIEKALEQAIDDDGSEQCSGQSQIVSSENNLKDGNEVHDDEERSAENVENNQSQRPEVCVTVTLESGSEVNDITQCGNDNTMEQASSVSAKRPSDIPLKASCDDTKPGSTKKMVSPAQPKADVSSCEEAMENLSIDYVRVNQKLSKLPSPSEFGHGNPFLMFCCLTLLVQQRDHIMANRMDYNDLAMHFDRMVRKHDVHKVVHQARTLYTNYLKSMQSTENTIASDTPSSDDVSV